MAPIHFYFEKNIDYLGLLEEYRNAGGYADCVRDCDGDRECIERCETNNNNPERQVAKMVMAPKGDPLAGIIFTEAFREALSPREAEDRGLVPVTTVDIGDKDVSELDVVNVTVEDLLSPHSRIDGRTVCEAVGDLTNQALTAMDYAVNGRSNPRFVLAECMDIHARVKLGQVASENADDIINLLDDEAYERFCLSQEHEGDRGRCEVVASWMKAGPDDAPKSICKLMKGRFWSEKCGVDTEQRDRIKAYIRSRVNSCFGEMGCVYNDKKFMRRHTKGNFPVGSVPTHMCCKRSLKAVAKAVLRMDRLYKLVGNMTLAEQMALINSSNMTNEYKRQFIQSIQESHATGDRIMADLKVDRPTQVFMETFAVMVRSSLGEELDQFMQLGSATASGNMTESDTEERLLEITGSREKASRVMDLLKTAASSISAMIMKVSRLLLEASKFFAKMGFNLVKWILHHPTTAMWLAQAAVLFKKEMCREVSLKIFGDPEMVEIGLWAKTEDMYKHGMDKAATYYKFIKKSFYSIALQSVSSTKFWKLVEWFGNTIQSWLETCLMMIPPPYGPGIVAAIKMATSSKVFEIMKQSLSIAMVRASQYALTALVIKEAGNDIVEVLMGTCIAPPDVIKKLTVAAVEKEVDQVLVPRMKRPAEFNPFSRQQQKQAGPVEPVVAETKEEKKVEEEKTGFYTLMKGQRLVNKNLEQI